MKLLFRLKGSIPIAIFLALSFFPKLSFAQPGNDACGSATLLVSGPTCANTAGTLKNNATNVGATATAGINAFCGNASSPDVWYSFVAQSTFPTISLSSMGTNMALSPRLQLFNTTSCTVATLNANSNTCVSGTNTTTLSLTPGTALTIGTTYLVRVFTNGTNVAATPSNTWNFNICITDAAPANDACASAVTLTSGPTCSNTAGTLYAATATAGINAFCGSTTSADVWYSFVAQSTSPTIALSSMGTNLDNTPRLQLFNTNSCTVATLNSNSNTCVSGTAVTSLNLTPATALTIGSTYLVRVFTNTAMTGTLATWNFNICVTDAPPANDACAGAITLTSGLTCANTAGTLYSATATAGINAFCGSTTSPDVWYSFVAQSTSPTIALSSMGTNLDNTPRLQLFNTNSCTVATLNSNSNNCVSGTAVTSLSLTPATALTIGSTYLVRVFTNSAMTGALATWNFNICITDVPPTNDACASAISLTSGPTCSNTAGTLYGATATAGINAFCGSTTSPDVWYSFVAQSTSPTIDLSSMGSNMSSAPKVQIFNTSSCTIGTLNSNSNTCVSGTAVTSLSLTPATSLTIGSTYLVRVFSNTAMSGAASTWAFNICISDPGPANDNCANAITLTSNSACSNTAGTLYGATATAGINAFCGSTTSADVWYTFIAQSTSPTISLSSMGTSMDNTPRLQIFNTNSCTVATLNANSNNCVSGTAVTSLNLTPATALTIGSTYLVRVFTNSAMTGALATWNFNICIDDPAPPNDNCASAVTLTSATSCVNTTASMYGATLSAATITAPNCASSVSYDVWYKFVAQTTNPTITLSSLGVGFTNPAMQLLSNNCGGTFTSFYCGTTSIAADYLVPGTTYFIRVYSTSGSAPTSYNSGVYSICIVDPVMVPFNDECVNAINLTVGVNTCSTIPTTIGGATASAEPVAPCTGPVAYDVWYKFTATSASSTITLGGSANNFTNRQIQIFSGTCGSLTSVACGVSPVTFVSTAGTGYFVRVYSTTGPAPNGNADFTICVNGGANAPVRYGNSYVNITKKTNGGVVEPGDILEIRMTVNHTSGTMTALRYVDNVPSKTSMQTGPSDFIRIITNEGLTYKSYTLAAGDDAATYKASPGAGEYNIRMNLGFGGSLPGTPTNNTNAAATATGTMTNTNRPSGGGGLLFAIAYRVQVTGVVGDTITLFPGQFIYQNGGVDVTLSATPFKILISTPLNLCANSIGLNNAVENGGTFGSGTTLNRSTDLTTPIAGYTYVPNVSANVSVNDGRYAIVKNLSPRSSSVSGARRQPACNVGPALAPTDPLVCANRMFGGFWYIDGDHSGTSTPTGNPPPATATNGGYMLMVNADFVASEVYRQTITNLCPNTYYEFSAWVKNICPTCGIDSIGAQFTGTATAPANGYPGVLPNLTFALNDLDYYNTGEMDTIGWQKKGFVFKTDTAQTTATFSIRNNAQGGGGNDWALDDIAIATCLPSMQYSPSITPMICEGNPLVINDTVRSYFNNYTYYKWQRSTDNGSNWNDITATVNSSLTFNGSIYQFITSYTIPPANTTLSDSADLYRVIVATSSTNLLSNPCLFTDASTIITLSVLNCGPVLSVDLISFSGKLNNKKANLIWTTSKETEPVYFSVERSLDGINFTSIGTVTGHGNLSSESNYYDFTDPAIILGKTWYRIIMLNSTGRKKYSRIISLSDKTLEFGLNNVVNPFNPKLDFEIVVPENSRVEATLLTLSGNPVKKESYNVYEGANSLTIPDTEALPAGMYILQIKNKDKIINKKVIKR